MSNSIACDGSFDVVASPNGTGHNDIFATSALSANDVWAVGVQTNASNYDRTLAEHWNGTTWSIVPTPNPGSTHNDLNGVAAISSTDVWVVGDYFDALIGGWLQFAAHWNGSTWTTTIFNYGFLFGVTALASNNVWAVGTTFFSPFDSVVMHWDGLSWSQWTSPDPGTYDNELFHVSALSASDIWAVGEIEATSSSPLQSFAVHFDGFSWTTVATPNDTGTNVVLSVTALESGHAVGVGYAGFNSGISPAHGEAWDLVASGGSTDSALLAPGTGDNLLEAVAGSGGSVWAVGFWRATSSSARQTLAWPAAWNSSTHTLTWGSIGTSASPGGANNVLFAVSAVSPNVFWAAGYANSGGFDQSLMESYCAIHFGVTAPASAVTGVPFSLTVTAKNSNGSTATGYLGTVHFTSTDTHAVLPPDYTFTPPDAGAHTFTGVTLNTPYSQTITVSDTVTAFITGSAVIAVTCAGVCQSPTGSAGSRGANQTPSAGTGGSRSANPSTGSGPAPPGTRTARFRAGTTAVDLPGSIRVEGADMSGAPSTTAPNGKTLRGDVAPTHGIVVEPALAASRNVRASSYSAPNGSAPRGNPDAAIAVGAAALIPLWLIWARRRDNRRLNDQTRP